MKKAMSLLLVLLMLITFMPASFAGDVKTMDAVKSSQNITIDGEKIELNAYNIAGSNYLKLRDIAAVMVGKKASFNVDYDKAKNKVVIETGKAYTKLPSDLKATDIVNAKAIVSEKEIILNRDDKEIIAAYINKNNYVKLRDIAKIVGFYVSYDKNTNTVEVKSDTKYDIKDDDNKETKKNMVMFDLYDLDGERKNIFEEIKKHQYTLVNLWGTFCKYCIEELPELQKLAKEYDDVEDKEGNDKLGVIGIVMDVTPLDLAESDDKNSIHGRDAKELNTILKEMNLDYYNYTPSSAAMEYYSELISGYPTTLIIDRNGKIVETIVGGTTYENFKRYISKYIK